MMLSRSLRLLALAVLAASATAAQTGPVATGSVAGRVVDASTGAPVPGATVRLGGTARGAAADTDGAFRLDGVAAGQAVLLTSAVGYVGRADTLAVRVGETSHASIHLAPDTGALGEVVVRARAGALPTSLTLEGEALRERLGGTVAATLTGTPGLWQRYNGPSAAQPVVRGLAGDRVLVLEDGVPTGDVATTAPDHAVTVDPLTARRIDVVRGPAALLYSSVVLGGVVDVVREDIPLARPDRLQVSAQAQGESAVRGAGGGAEVLAPLGPLAVRAEASGRFAGDTSTPEGDLPFTDLDARTLGAGASWSHGRLRLGAAARDVRQMYGVPSTFGGVTLPGAHDGGIYVDLYRQTARVEAQAKRVGPFQSVGVDASASRFYQAEYELGGFVGTEFGQVLGSARAVGRYGREGTTRGGVGLSALSRDWAAAGSQTGTRPALQRGGAVFAYHEQPLGGSPLGALTLQAGLRFDVEQTVPRDTTSSRIASGLRLTGIRERRFAEPSGALALLAAPAGGWVVGVSGARSVRLPAVEELYSNGPHLASYAYEVGNPTLGAEVGWGAEATVYASRVDGYVRYAPLVDAATGRPVLDYRLRRYEVYQATASDARFVGAEGRLALAPAGRLSSWTLDLTAQYVRGTDAEADEPLPFIPPLHARLAVSREEIRLGVLRLNAGLALDAAARQRRVPAPPPGLIACLGAAPGSDGCPEALPGEFVPTDGRVLLGGHLGVRFGVRGAVHTVALRVENALNTAWRDPLSRIKSVAPQPGRNVTLTYRIDL
ncbi:MAG TPA: TonB-dependent receptor [Rhodothermales bacterium]|nr:TonB-dependent receptor [Rhodothermales bacterium]